MMRATKILTLALLWLVPCVTLSVALLSDWTTTWNDLNIPSLRPPFNDLRSITNGVKTLQQGGNPLIENKSDPQQRPMNYPRIWLYLFSGLGIRDANVRIVGVTFCVLYLVCVSWLIIQCTSILGMLTLLAAGLSLAPLLALERGNTDLFIFALVFLGCIASNKYFKSGALFVAAVLKLFPFAAMLVGLVRGHSKARSVHFALTALAMVTFALQWHDLQAIQAFTPVSPTLSFGMPSLRAQAPFLSVQLLAWSCALAAAIACSAWLTRPNLDEHVLESKVGEMFTIFGAIYVFTFLLSSNWNYRLIFLVPTLPLAIELARNSRNRRWAIVYIASVLIAENSFAFGIYKGVPTGDIATFGIFAMILAILPQQMRSFFSSAGTMLQVPASVAASASKGFAD
jgi:hypothetical protein